MFLDKTMPSLSFINNNTTTITATGQQQQQTLVFGSIVCLDLGGTARQRSLIPFCSLNLLNLPPKTNLVPILPTVL